jgi:tRNA threonylcarbamoyladenosine biosynthesis protein TsaB
VLPMVAAVLQESGLRLQDLDGLAYGRGPGAFTGVRIAVGVAQGLAYGAQLPTVGVSDLAAVAQQVARVGERILVCMDARMGEVYWATFLTGADGLVSLTGTERVDRPEAVVAGDATVFAGTGFSAYPQLAAGRDVSALHISILPHAREIARLAESELHAGRGESAEQARPVYLRDRVVAVKTP